MCTYAKTLKHYTNFSGRADHKIVASLRWNSQDKKDYFDSHDYKFELSRTSYSKCSSPELQNTDEQQHQTLDNTTADRQSFRN